MFTENLSADPKFWVSLFALGSAGFAYLRARGHRAKKRDDLVRYQELEAGLKVLRDHIDQELSLVRREIKAERDQRQVSEDSHLRFQRRVNETLDDLSEHFDRLKTLMRSRDGKQQRA